MKTVKEVKDVVYEMLTECTGAAMCDSGGVYGRHWERNQKKTLADFENEPPVAAKWYDEEYGGYTISLYHWLVGQLELDSVCEKFNEINTGADDWDGETYGVSKEAENYLISKAGVSFTFKDNERHICYGQTFNSYNGDSSLSQVIQGTHLDINGQAYLLLQIHQGCDVRGGYTDARLFKVVAEYFGSEDVYGLWTPKDADLETPALIKGVDVATVAGVLQLSNCYNGYSLTIDDSVNSQTNEEFTCKENEGKLELWLAEY